MTCLRLPAASPTAQAGRRSQKGKGPFPDENQVAGAAVPDRGQASLRELVTDIFTQTFGITALLMAIALIVSAVGVATTLAVGVLERRKELNTLRALGGSRGQVRTLIYWEACLLGLVGAALGLLCGFVLSVVFIEAINKQGFGWTFAFAVNWPQLGLVLPGLLLAAVLAAMPARFLALNQSPTIALRER